MFITPTVSSFEHTRHAHFDAYASLSTAGLPCGAAALVTEKRRSAKMSGGACMTSAGSVCPKESVKKRLVAKIVKMLTVKEKNDSVTKLKKCIARNAKLYAAASAVGVGGGGCRYGAARWRRYSGTATPYLVCPPRASIGALSLNFEPLLPTIVEETEIELRNEC